MDMMSIQIYNNIKDAINILKFSPKDQKTLNLNDLNLDLGDIFAVEMNLYLKNI